MLTAVNELEEFRVPLVGGQSVTLWADGYSRHPGELVFSVLADVDPDEQAALHITGRTPTDPRRVIVVIARLPTALMSGDWWRDLPEWTPEDE